MIQESESISVMVAQSMNEVALKYSSSHNTLVMVQVHYTLLLSTYKQTIKDD